MPVQPNASGLRDCRDGFLRISRLTTAYQCRFGESNDRRRYANYVILEDTPYANFEQPPLQSETSLLLHNDNSL